MKFIEQAAHQSHHCLAMLRADRPKQADSTFKKIQTHLNQGIKGKLDKESAAKSFMKKFNRCLSPAHLSRTGS